MKGFVTSSEKALEASYLVSLRIAKTEQFHTIGENLILLVAKDIILTLFSEKATIELDNITL
ncbi:Zinc finger BED domain-containing protein 5, partial [Stegodyphus mimosarum]